jgi:hypothetical protein
MDQNNGGSQAPPANLAEAMQREDGGLAEALRESDVSRETIIDPRNFEDEIIFSNGPGIPDRKLSVEKGGKQEGGQQQRAESKNGEKPSSENGKEKPGADEAEIFEFSYGKVDVSAIPKSVLAKMILQDRLLSKAQSRAQKAENELKKFRSRPQQREEDFYDDDINAGIDDEDFVTEDEDENEDDSRQRRRDASGRFADKLDPNLPESLAILKKRFEKARNAHLEEPTKKTARELEDRRQAWLEARQDHILEERLKSAQPAEQENDPYSWTDHLADAEHYVGIFGMTSRVEVNDVAYAYEQIVKVGVPQAERKHGKKIDLNNPRVQAALWKEAIKVSLEEKKTDAGSGDGKGAGPADAGVRGEKPYWALSKSGAANPGQSAENGGVGRQKQPGEGQSQRQRSRFRNLGELMASGS